VSVTRSAARRRPSVPAQPLPMPVMNRRMASTLGLCRLPRTPAEGLSLFHPPKLGKVQPSMATKPAVKPSRFAHLVGISRPAELPQTGAPSPAAAHPTGSKPRLTFTTAAEAAAHILQAGGRYGARR
jgi:hypothetical protein